MDDLAIGDPLHHGLHHIEVNQLHHQHMNSGISNQFDKIPITVVTSPSSNSSTPSPLSAKVKDKKQVVEPPKE